MKRHNWPVRSPPRVSFIELKSSMARRVQFTEAKKKEQGLCSDCTSGDETLLRESNQDSGRDAEVSGRHDPSGPARMVCPGSQCQADHMTEFCPESRDT